MDVCAESDMTVADELFQDHKAIVLIMDSLDGRIMNELHAQSGVQFNLRVAEVGKRILGVME